MLLQNRRDTTVWAFATWNCANVCGFATCDGPEDYGRISKNMRFGEIRLMWLLLL